MANLVRSEMIPQIEMETAISNIDLNPIDVVEKLGKYQFIYDYQVPATIFYDLANSSVHLTNEQVSNQVAIPQPVTTSSASGFNWADIIKSIGQQNMLVGSTLPYNIPQPVSVNANPQVGFFSKGNVVEVVSFNGSNAVIKNPNYVPVQTTTNSGGYNWTGLFGSPVKMKEFNIPKEYLSKVDDSFVLTVDTGINYGANLKPQPVYNTPPVKTIPFNPVNQTILEENASFLLIKDFPYQTNEYVNTCPQGAYCITGGYYKQGILKAGTKLTGQLFREIDNNAYKVQAGAITPPPYKDYLAVKGYGSQGSINIPIEYLTKDIPTNSGIVVPVANDNNNLLLIAGAVILGYALFSNDESE